MSSLSGQPYSTQERQEREVYEGVLAKGSFADHHSLKRAAALMTALGVHTVTLALLVAGTYWIVSWSYPVVGVLCLVIVWFVRPKLESPQKGLVARAGAPVLFELIDTVAERLGALPVHNVGITARCDVSISRARWRRRTYLSIGLPLLTVLDAQERVALLARAQVPGTGGISSTLIRGASSTLARWHTVFSGSSASELEIYSASAQGGTTESMAVLRRTADPSANVAATARLLAMPLMWLLDLPVRAAATALSRLTWQNRQRTQYAADAKAAGVAGSAALVSALAKVSVVRDILVAVAHETALESHGSEAVLQHLREGMAGAAAPSRPPEDRSRMSKELPPTAFRITVLQRYPRPSVFSLSHSDSARIDVEMRQFEERVNQQIEDDYRATLYG
jgi:hypothetical protein